LETDPQPEVAAGYQQESRLIPRTIGLVFIATIVFTARVGADYVVEDDAITRPLTDQQGVPSRGQAVVIDRELGNCLSCHVLPVDAEFFGTTGPSLVGAGDRWTPPELRLRLVDPKVINPMTMMPSYFKSKGLYRVLDEFEGKSILTPQQIEDVVAYLETLRQ
jgi:L-cysteine S-thiosulfotransferase